MFLNHTLDFRLSVVFLSLPFISADTSAQTQIIFLFLFLFLLPKLISWLSISCNYLMKTSSLIHVIQLSHSSRNPQLEIFFFPFNYLPLYYAISWNETAINTGFYKPISSSHSKLQFQEIYREVISMNAVGLTNSKV